MVDRLRAAGMLRDAGFARAATSRARPALAVAATLALIALGALIGRATVDAPGADIEPRAQFALILYDGPEFEAYTEDNYPERFGDYNAWFADLRAAGQFVAGEALDPTARVLVPGADGPSAEERLPAAPDGTISGVLFIRAESYEDAVRIASSIPHLQYGGRVAVRRVDPT